MKSNFLQYKESNLNYILSTPKSNNSSAFNLFDKLIDSFNFLKFTGLEKFKSITCIYIDRDFLRGGTELLKFIFSNFTDVDLFWTGVLYYK